MQAKLGRSGNLEQYKQNSSNLGTAFQPSPGDEDRVGVRDHATKEKGFSAENQSRSAELHPDFHSSERRESPYRGGSHFPSRNYHAKRPKLMAFLDGGPSHSAAPERRCTR